MSDSPTTITIALTPEMVAGIRGLMDAGETIEEAATDLLWLGVLNSKGRNRTMNGLEDVMGAFVGHPINEDTLTALLAEVQSATTGTATLLPSDFINGEVRVQVAFGDHAVVASIRSAGVELVRV